MKRKLKFIVTLLKMRLSHMMVFRLTFFGALFVDGTMFVIQILTFSAIYANVGAIGNFSKGEMIIFIGTFSLINALTMVTFFFGVSNIPSKIRSGELDHYITKPINPLFRITFENIDIGSLPLTVLSVGIIIYGVSQVNIQLNAVTVLVYILWVILMSILWYDVMLILRTIPFFFISTESISSMEGTLLDFCMKIPGTLFKGVFKVLFYFVLPYGVMSTIPTQYLSGKLSAVEFLYGVFIVAAFTIFALWFWRFGLRHYKSASS